MKGALYMSELNRPAAPGEGPLGTPTPSLPPIDQPASPGEGPLGTPTPSLPSIDQPASPGEGPLGTPTPSLPSNPAPGNPPPFNPVPPSSGQTFVFRCPTGYTAGQVQRGQSFTDLLLLYNVSYNAMRAANPNLSTGTPAAGSFYCAPPSGSRRVCTYGTRSYVMSQGENFNTLLRTLNTTAAALLRANPELAPGDFLPGRVICQP